MADKDSGAGGGTITESAVTDWRVQNADKFKLRAKTVEEEAMFDVVAARHVEKPSGVVNSIAQLIKGALGAGVISGHVAYMAGGVAVALITHLILGLYMMYCFYLLYKSASILYQRTRIPVLNYSDLGEAALLCTERPRFVKWSRCFRKFIDVVICIDLFGSCVVYQLIVAKTLKQLVEDTQQSSMAAMKPGYPNLRVYLLILWIPFVIITLIRHLEFLAPFSLAANFVVVLCIGMTIYYFTQNNPNFNNLVLYTDLQGFLKFVGMTVFSMSCSGVVLAVENNMACPTRFPIALYIGMSFNIWATLSCAFFGYVAYLHKCDAPITMNFPMTIGPKILKGAMCFMVYVTHALNFWVPFNNCFYYVKLKYPQEKHLKLEYIMRTIICSLITLTAIAFPKVASVISIIGTFCLSLMSFMWPNFIYLLVIGSRPGYGAYRYRLVIGTIMIVLGFFLWTAGTFCNVLDLIKDYSSNTI